MYVCMHFYMHVGRYVCTVDLRPRVTRRRLAGLSPAEGLGPIIRIFRTVTVVDFFCFVFFMLIYLFVSECFTLIILFRGVFVSFVLCCLCFYTSISIYLFRGAFYFDCFVFLVSCFSLLVCLCGVDNRVN